MKNFELLGKKHLPEIIQTEAAECGIACITMIASYYGHDIDLRSTRSKFPVSLKGITVEAIISIAEKLDLGARALKLSLENIEKLSLPAILHWDLNHFVVLKRITRKHIEIHDPARGLVQLTKKEFSDHFTGVAIELYPSAKFKKRTLRKKVEFSSLWSKLIGLKTAISHTFILSMFMQLCIVASPFYLQLVLDEAILKFDLDFLFVLAFGFGFLAIFRTLVTAMRAWTIAYYGNQAGFQLVANIFQHLLYIPLDFFEKRHVGDVLSRMGSANPIQNAMTQSIVSAIIDGLMAVFTGFVLFVYSPLLGSIVLCSVILIIVANLAFFPIIRRKQEDTIISEAKKESYEIECIRAIATVKLFSAQSQRLAGWRNLFVTNINARLSMSKYQILLSTITNVITSLQAIIIIYFSAKMVINNQLHFTIGMLVAFMSYRQYFTDSSVALMEKIVEFRLLSLHLERIADITETEPETEESSYFINDSSINEIDAPYIEFKNVNFRFSDNDPWVLFDASFKIDKGDCVLLSGDSGGGKTTLIKLMLGLYQPSSGEILIKGKPLNNLKTGSWRKSISVVLQNDQLLTGTLADNISFFDEKWDLAKVVKAAKFARIHDVISTMPMQYLSYIGDMGSMLSAGQKQRVLIARAIYREPELLILDEGTVNIDKAKEKSIVEAVGMLNNTRIIVSHSNSFISAQNKHFKVISGKVVEV